MEHFSYNINPKLNCDCILVYMVLWIDLPTGIFAATYNVMNVERALITTMESERNTVAVCEVVVSRKSATICRQITFVRDTWIYTIVALTHVFVLPTRSGSAECRNCTTGRDAVPSAKHKAVWQWKLVEEYFSVFLRPRNYERIGILVKRL